MLKFSAISMGVGVGLLLLSSGPIFAIPPTAPRPPAVKSKRLPLRSPKVLFKPPIGFQRPARTTGAGSRNGRLCPQDIAMAVPQTVQAGSAPLTALVPTDRFGLTAMERPTFWIYVPPTTAKQILLSVEGEDGSFHSQTAFPVPDRAGIISLSLPKTAPPLKVGATYRWAALLVCGDRPNPNDMGVDAWVYRVPPAPSAPLTSTLDKAVWDAEQGIWYDLLTGLSKAARSQPQASEAADILTDVLTAQGLDAVTSLPTQN